MLKHLSSDTVKGCSSSSWVAAYLGSTTSLSTSEKKSNNPHIALRRKDVFSSSHRSLRSRSYSVPSQGRRHLELCRSVDCALAPRFLAPVHVYIHFQAHWACLVVIETNEKHVQRHDASYIAWRSSKEERRRTQEVLLLRRRGPARPQSAYGESTFSLFPCVFMVFVLDKTVIARASIV